MKHFCLQKISLGVAVVAFAIPQAKAVVNYGDFFGTTVVYRGVQEEALSVGDSAPLYGTPTIAGNALDFNPIGFSASASGGTFDFTDGQLDLTIEALNGNVIPTIQFSENGDFDLFGAGTALTLVDISAKFYIDVVGVDGNSVFVPQAVADMTFSPTANGTMTLPGYPGFSQSWSGVFSFDVNAWLTANSISYVSGATEIKVTLDNKLAAFSEAGSIAFIAKKDFKGFGITVPEVPEPTTFALLLCGGGLLLARRKVS